MYMRKYTFIAEYPNFSPKLNGAILKYDHPYFGFLFLGVLLKIIGYPNILSPFANGIANAHLIEMLYFFPRLLMGILGVVDTLLIFEIAERYYNRNVALIASILFAVMPTYLCQSVVL
jgi:asparagine N-glycosylation enzyme membrane subunit Stt3